MEGICFYKNLCFVVCLLLHSSEEGSEIDVNCLVFATCFLVSQFKYSFMLFWCQVLVLPLPHRPLFPGFYMPIYVKVLRLLHKANFLRFFFFFLKRDFLKCLPDGAFSCFLKMRNL